MSVSCLCFVVVVFHKYQGKVLGLRMIFLGKQEQNWDKSEENFKKSLYKPCRCLTVC